MALGARIKEARGEMTQGDLCARVPGLSQQALSNLEARDSKTSEHAVAIADALGVSLRWLLTGEGAKTSDWPFVRVTRAQLDALDDVDRLLVEGQLIQAIANLPPHRRGEFPATVVTIPERRGKPSRRLTGGLALRRRASDKKVGHG